MKDENKTLKINELSREHITRAKRLYWNDKKIQEGSRASFAELEIIDELVSDDEIFKAYGHLRFSEHDFDW